MSGISCMIKFVRLCLQCWSASWMDLQSSLTTPWDQYLTVGGFEGILSMFCITYDLQQHGVVQQPHLWVSRHIRILDKNIYVTCLRVESAWALCFVSDVSYMSVKVFPSLRVKMSGPKAASHECSWGMLTGSPPSWRKISSFYEHHMHVTSAAAAAVRVNLDPLHFTLDRIFLLCVYESVVHTVCGTHADTPDMCQDPGSAVGCPIIRNMSRSHCCAAR